MRYGTFQERTHLNVDKSQTLIWRLWLEEKSMRSSGLSAKAVTDSESASRVERMAAVTESTILIDSPQAQAMKELSDETTKGPPV